MGELLDFEVIVMTSIYSSCMHTETILLIAESGQDGKWHIHLNSLGERRPSMTVTDNER